MAFKLEDLRGLTAVLVGTTGAAKWNAKTLSDLVAPMHAKINTRFSQWTKVMFCDPSKIPAAKLKAVKDAGIRVVAMDDLIEAVVEHLDPTTEENQARQPRLSAKLLKNKRVMFLQPTPDDLADLTAYVKGYGAVTVPTGPFSAGLVLIVPDDKKSWWKKTIQKLEEAEAKFKGSILVYRAEQMRRLIENSPPKFQVPPLTADLLKGRTVTLVGRGPTGLDAGSLNASLGHLDVAVSAKFTTSTSIVFFNPKSVEQSKLVRALAAGVLCYTYASAQEFLARDLQDQAPTVDLDPELADAGPPPMNALWPLASTRLLTRQLIGHKDVIFLPFSGYPDAFVQKAYAKAVHQLQLNPLPWHDQTGRIILFDPDLETYGATKAALMRAKQGKALAFSYWQFKALLDELKITLPAPQLNYEKTALPGQKGPAKKPQISPDTAIEPAGVTTPSGAVLPVYPEDDSTVLSADLLNSHAAVFGGRNGVAVAMVKEKYLAALAVKSIKPATGHTIAGQVTIAIFDPKDPSSSKVKTLSDGVKYVAYSYDQFDAWMTANGMVVPPVETLALPAGIVVPDKAFTPVSPGTEANKLVLSDLFGGKSVYFSPDPLGSSEEITKAFRVAVLNKTGKVLGVAYDLADADIVVYDPATQGDADTASVMKAIADKKVVGFTYATFTGFMEAAGITPPNLAALPHAKPAATGPAPLLPKNDKTPFTRELVESRKIMFLPMGNAFGDVASPSNEAWIAALKTAGLKVETTDNPLDAEVFVIDTANKALITLNARTRAISGMALVYEYDAIGGELTQWGVQAPKAAAPASVPSDDVDDYAPPAAGTPLSLAPFAGGVHDLSVALLASEKTIFCPISDGAATSTTDVTDAYIAAFKAEGFNVLEAETTSTCTLFVIDPDNVSSVTAVALKAGDSDKANVYTYEQLHAVMAEEGIPQPTAAELQGTGVGAPTISLPYNPMGPSVRTPSYPSTSKNKLTVKLLTDRKVFFGALPTKALPQALAQARFVKNIVSAGGNPIPAPVGSASVSFVDSTAFGKDADTTQAIKSGVAGKTWVYTYAQLVSWLQSVGGESDMSAPAPAVPATPNADGISPSFSGPLQPQISPDLFFAPMFFCGTATQNTDQMAALYTKAVGDLGGWNSTPVSATVVIYDPSFTKGSLATAALMRVQQGLAKGITYDQLNEYLQTQKIAVPGTALPAGRPLPDSTPVVPTSDASAKLTAFFAGPANEKKMYFSESLMKSGKQEASLYEADLKALGASSTTMAAQADMLVYAPGVNVEGMDATAAQFAKEGVLPSCTYDEFESWMIAKANSGAPAPSGGADPLLPLASQIPEADTMLSVYPFEHDALSWGYLEEYRVMFCGSQTLPVGSIAPHYIKRIADQGKTVKTVSSGDDADIVFFDSSSAPKEENERAGLQKAKDGGALAFTYSALHSFLELNAEVDAAAAPVEPPTPNVPSPPAIDKDTAPALGLYPTIPAGTNKALTFPMITGGKLVFGPKAGVANGPAAYKTVLKHFAPTVTTKMNLATVMFFDPASDDAETAQIKAYAGHGSAMAWTYDQLDMLIKSVGLVPPSFAKGKGNKPAAQHLPAAPSTQVNGAPVHLSLALLKKGKIYVLPRPGETATQTALKVSKAFSDKGLLINPFWSPTVAVQNGADLTAANMLLYPAEGMTEKQEEIMGKVQAAGVPCFTFTQLDQVGQQVGVALDEQPKPVDMSPIYPAGSKDTLSMDAISGMTVKMLPTSFTQDQSALVTAYTVPLGAVNAVPLGQFAGQKAQIVVFDPALYPSDPMTKKFVDFAKAGTSVAYTYEQLNAAIVAKGMTVPTVKSAPVTPSYTPTAPAKKSYAVPPGLYKAKIYDGIEPCVPARNKNINYPAWDYSGGAYHGYNDPLTFGTTPSKGDQQEIEDLVLDLLLGKDKAATLYRGVKNSKAVGKYMTAEMKPGHVFLKPAFFSASKKRSVAENFGGTPNSYDKNVMFVLDTSEVKGIYLGTASQCPSEAELLLPPRITLTITKVVDNLSQRELHCKARMDPQFTHPDPVGKVARLSDAVVSIEERLAALSKGGATASLIEDDDWA